MDRLLYTAMSGARQLLEAQAVNSNNLANVSTTGFQADLRAAQAWEVRGPGHGSRAMTVGNDMGWDHSPGSRMHTGHNLDVAIRGEGFIAIQPPDGNEAYTRAGDLRVDPNGLLRTGAGHPVLGDGGGPIAIPPHESLTIGDDGTISIVPLGQTPDTLAAVDRIRLVAPEYDTLQKGADGLLRTIGDEPPPADAAVRLQSGTLEGSNVNAADAMVTMIQISRQYETQIRMMKTAEDNDARAAELLRTGG